jgi:hypothetical protein
MRSMCRRNIWNCRRKDEGVLMGAVPEGTVPKVA